MILCVGIACFDEIIFPQKMVEFLGVEYGPVFKQTHKNMMLAKSGLADQGKGKYK